MSAVTPPPTDDGGAAMAEAVDALHNAAYTHGSTGARFGDVVTACSAASAHVLSIHAAALARAEAAERDAYARGRAEAFAEVNAQIETVTARDADDCMRIWLLGPEHWRAEVLTPDGCEVGVGDTPSSAIGDLSDVDAYALAPTDTGGAS